MSHFLKAAEQATRDAKAAREQIDVLAAQESMTVEEAATFDALVIEANDLDAKATALRTRHEAAQASATALGGYTATTSLKTAQASTAPVLDGPVRLAAEDDPKKGFKTPREFLSCVMDAGRGRAEDERLKLLAAAGGDEQSTFADPFGGYLVPEGLAPGLMTTAWEGDPLAQFTTKIPMATPTVKINARVDKDHSSSVSGGLRVYRRAEADTSSSSRMQFEQVELNANGLLGIAYATNEILTDSPISFAAILAAGFGDEFGSVKMKERLTGNGVGEFLGVNNSGALISITKETGQAADTIVYENVIKARARTWGYQNAVWHANHDCLPQLMLMNQSVGTGGIPVWQPSAREDHPDMLLGRPLIFTEHAETVGDAGDLMCCNWSQYLEGNLGGTEAAESIHVRFVNLESTFRFFQRNDGKPWWLSALTPDKGSTLSPFVRIAARA